MRWFLARLREPSTWRGLVWLLTVFGLSLRPDQAEAIVIAGMALAGLLGVFLSDRPDSTLRTPVGNSGHSTASGADPVRDALPDIELVGKPLGAAGRNGAQDHGVEYRRADSAHFASGMRQPMPPQDSPRPHQSSDPNTFPRFGAGFGDRD